MLQGQIGFAVVLMMYYRMAVKKCPPGTVLAGETDGVALVHQGGIGHGLGITPVHGELAGAHAPPLLDDLAYRRVQLESFRDGGNTSGKPFDRLL